MDGHAADCCAGEAVLVGDDIFIDRSHSDEVAVRSTTSGGLRYAPGLWCVGDAAQRAVPAAEHAAAGYVAACK